jgi:aminotransferase
MTRSSRDSDNLTPEHSPSSRLKSNGPEMRIIVPLQGVVQGRGGLVLGSLLPCALFYFLQLYLKSRNRPSQSRSSSPSPPSSPDDHNTSPSSPPSASSSSLHRTLSRGVLSPRSHPSVSVRAAAVARPEKDSLYYVGYKRCLEDAYHRVDNPEGVIQLGLAENRVITI